MIRAERVSNFKGQDVVLVRLDLEGLGLLRSALLRMEADQENKGWTATDGDKIHATKVEPGSARIELAAKGMTWWLARDKAQEIAAKLGAMIAADGPCHHYVDIDAPVGTLVLSRDEYSSPLGV